MAILCRESGLLRDTPTFHKSPLTIPPPPTFRLRSNIQANRMAYENTVLSLNPDNQTLLGHESALRDNGFEIISVSSPLQARFEIEMGRCGLFLTSHITPRVILKDLASLFRRSCPNGLVIFVAQRLDDAIPDADILLSVGENPHSLVERLRSKQEKKIT